MAEEFQGSVCGGTWWNPPRNLFSGGLSSPCSVAQLGGGFDMGGFGWSNELTKGHTKSNNNSPFLYHNLVFSDHMDSSLDILGFGLSPTSSTTDWGHQSLFGSGTGSNEANFDSILQDNLNFPRSNYGTIGENSPTITMNSSTNNFSNNNNIQDESPPMGLTGSSNSSGDNSSTITSCEPSLATSFPTGSSASYLIQSLFDDTDESQLLNSANYGCVNPSEILSPGNNCWVKDGANNNPPMINGDGRVLNGQHPDVAALSNIRVSLLNSLQSRSRAHTFNQKSHGCGRVVTKVTNEEIRQGSKNNINSNSDQPQAKRARIETPSPLPTFKVRKEKLGDRITALQQLVSPFGKTDTASVLHEAIEYIKFLHDQVHALSTPYLKNGAANAMQQQGFNKLKDINEEPKQDLRSKGLCVVPISSTYPVAQETPVDFWTPTFGGTTLR